MTQSTIACDDIASSGRAAPLTVMSIFGTRPEIVKFAPVIQHLESRTEFRTINVCTSQHTDLAAPFLKRFRLRIDHDLQVMRPGQSLNSLLARVIEGLEEVLAAVRPDFVMVQGDTASALAGALAAFHRKIQVGHIEAGLRSGNLHSPFPEEMNRILIDQVSALHFAATERNRENLLRMGIPGQTIEVTGNPVIDALMQILEAPGDTPTADSILNLTGDTRRIVLTAHRRENFDGRMAGYFAVLARFLEEHRDVSLVFPVHPNPRVREAANQHLAGLERVHLVDPLPYPDFVRLLSRAWIIVSDSGGVQEEAPTLGVPLLVIRDNTERPEAIECGAARLIGEDPAALGPQLEEAYRNDAWKNLVNQAVNPFGDGQASRRIADAIARYFAIQSTSR